MPRANVAADVAVARYLEDNGNVIAEGSLGQQGAISKVSENCMISLVRAAFVAALLAVVAASPAAFAQNSDAPGQDRTCLITSKNPGQFNDTDVAKAQWLPRKAAEQQASKDPATKRVFNYENDALVLNRTYASAEDLCKNHFPV